MIVLVKVRCELYLLYTGLTRSSATMRTMCGGLQWAGGSSSSVSTRGAAGAAIVH